MPSDPHSSLSGFSRIEAATLCSGMKLEVTLPSGTRLAFEGEREDFDHMSELLNLPEVIGTGFQASAPVLPPSNPPGHGGDGGGNGEGADETPIDPRALTERLQEVGVSKHTERVTVMAQVAVEAGREGIDFATAERLYRAIGEPRPANWKSAFSNARVAGLVQNVGRGLYRPTTRGENFALYGAEASGRTGRRRSGTRPQDDDSQGGGEDD
jgi:hypothetical protein